MGYQRARTAFCDYDGCEVTLLLVPPVETQLQALDAAGWQAVGDLTFCPAHHPPPATLDALPEEPTQLGVEKI